MWPLLLLACAPEPTPEPVDTGSPPPGPEASLSVLTTDGLTETSRAAVARMPAWLAQDLALALRQQDSDRQDVLAAVIVELDDPALLDEVGFAMAHLSKEVLRGDDFFPELLVENAQGIYAVDPLLDYVTLVEDGEPEVDADWRTTTRYRVEVEGKIQEIDLDAELYYWFVVHPRIEDERPWYIDAWAECNRNTLECAATPETGTFWRSFLWESAAQDCPEGEACPVLADYLTGVDVLWGAADGVDAVHGIAGMMLDSPDGNRWLSFGAYGERSIQPNRIYALGRGNCGEWADMTTALSRTALIPDVNVTPSSWDHTWNAFWLDRWIAWEPVNWWFDYPYGSGYTTWATRGDASMWYQTQQYNPNVATLTVTVKDHEGNPVDGAAVVLWSPYDTSYWYAGEQLTGLDGVATFEVGADKEFAYLVSSDLGDYPSSDSIDIATEGIAAGETENVRVRLDGTMPVAVPPSGELPAEDAAFTLTVTSTLEGRLVGESYRFGHKSTQPSALPPLTSALLSAADYEAFLAGQPWATRPGDLAAGVEAAPGDVYLLTNQGVLSTAVVGSLQLELTADGEPASLSVPVALEAGQWLAVRVGE